MDQTSFFKLNRHSLGNDFVIDDKFWIENPNKIDAALKDLGISVKATGALGDGFTDDTVAIQNTINNSPVGSVIFFPTGTYMISQILHFLPNRTYIGVGWSSNIKQMNRSNLSQLVDFGDQNQHPNVLIKDLQFDGNNAYNTNTVGLNLFGLSNSMLFRVRVQNCSGTGIFLDGNSTIQSSTNHFIDCWANSNGSYGINFSANCSDNHIIGGDYGKNTNPAVYIQGTSSSVRSAKLWGTTTGSCCIISGISNQVTDNNIEGASNHGIEVRASHNFVQGNKIYNNANLTSSYGNYDGVYVNGTTSANVVNVVITGNTIYASVTASTAYYRYAVNLDTYHANCEVNGNSVRYAKSNGTVSTTSAFVNGIKTGDIYNGALITTTSTRPASASIGHQGFDTTLNRPIWWSGSSWNDALGGTRNDVYELSFFTNGSVNSLTLNYTFPTPYTSTPFVTPGNITQSISYCNTMTYPFITNVSSTGFTVQLITANPANNFGSGTLKMNFKVEGK